MIIFLTGLFVVGLLFATKATIVAGCVILAILLLGNSFFRVPEVHAAVMSFLGWRSGRVCEEGPHLRFSFFEKPKIVSLEPTPPLEIKVVFMTRMDNPANAGGTQENAPKEAPVEVVCTGTIQLRPDLSIKRFPDSLVLKFLRWVGLDHITPYDGGKVIFIERSIEAILRAIQSEVQAKIGGLGGKYRPEDFNNHRQAISTIINMFLRVSKSLHLNHVPGHPDHCGLERCVFPSLVPAENLIAFYENHWPRAKSILDAEDNNPTDQSAVERRYGVDVITYKLDNVDFSKETKEALEEMRQAVARKGAAKQRLELVRELVTTLKQIDDPRLAQMALDEVDLTMSPGEVKKQEVSVQGEAGVLGVLAAKMGGK